MTSLDPSQLLYTSVGRDAVGMQETVGLPVS